MPFGNRLLDRRPHGLMFAGLLSRTPQVSVPSYSADGTRQFIVDDAPEPYYTTQSSVRSYILGNNFEVSIPPAVRQFIMDDYPEPSFINDQTLSEFIVGNSFKVTGVPTHSSESAPEPSSPDQIILWGDEEGDLLLWGDESGNLLLWGDTTT